MSDKNKNLYDLDDLSGYKVASHYSNVKGWEVQDADNRTIGKVDRLLVNKAAQRVVYLDVEVDKSIVAENHEPYANGTPGGVHEFLNKDGENHVIIPIGMVHLDKDNKIVRSNEISYSTFATTPRIGRGSDIPVDYENTIYRNFTGEDAFDRSLVSEETFYTRRQFINKDDEPSL